MEPNSTQPSANRVVERVVATRTSPPFGCESCDVEFATRCELAGHKAGKHRSHRCVTCGEDFENSGKLGRHKMQVHGYSREQLGWNRGGWNKGSGRVKAFNMEAASHVNPAFMSKMNSSEYANMSARRFHEEVVSSKEKELRGQGYRTFNTSNYARHNRIPDIIAISRDGRVFAIELETIRPYKCSTVSLKKKYTPLLTEGKFFDDVIVEGFTNEP